MAMKCLKQGDSGADVTTLQGDLASRGYGPCQSLYDGTIECDWAPGTFGSAVYSAVRDFQGDEGLGVDGVAGPNTWRALGRTGASCSSSSGSTRGTSGTSSTGVIPAAPPAGTGTEVGLLQRPWFWPVVGGVVFLAIMGGLYATRGGGE